jgi:hypothetical protein
MNKEIIIPSCKGIIGFFRGHKFTYTIDGLGVKTVSKSCYRCGWTPERSWFYG